MRIELVTFHERQDSSKVQAVDSTSTATMQSAEPEFRTPQNAGYMHIAYVVAAVIYGSYLLILRRRWSLLRQQQNNAAPSRR
ncbi:MAG: hypothetical protein ABI120_05005 [Gemmatimonadaceae bacterium]